MKVTKMHKFMQSIMLCIFSLSLSSVSYGQKASKEKIEQAQATLNQAKKDLKGAKDAQSKIDAQKIYELAENDLLRLEEKDCPATVIATKASQKKSKANLEKANLSGENLSYFQLAKANFKKANLINVNFSNADLQGADFSGADIHGALWRDANIAGAKFENVTGISKELSDKLSQEAAKKIFADYAGAYARAAETNQSIKVHKGMGIVVALDVLKNYLDGATPEEIQKKAIACATEYRKKAGKATPLDARIIINGIINPSMELIEKTAQTQKINLKDLMTKMRGNGDEEAFKMSYEETLKKIATQKSVILDAMANSGFM